jgi:hypothetical protein
MSLKPICMTCRVFYRPHRNGVFFTEGMPTGNGEWRPYKIWVGDLWKCWKCGHEIISGVGRNPIRVQHEPDFNHTQEVLGAKEIVINDC